MNDMTKYKAQEKYNERRLHEGFVRVTTWVPQRFREELLVLAEDMRQEDKLAQQAAEDAELKAG